MSYDKANYLTFSLSRKTSVKRSAKVIGNQILINTMGFYIGGFLDEGYNGIYIANRHTPNIYSISS